MLRRALVTTDSPAQALREGECQQLSRAEIGPTLSQLCAEPESVRPFQSRLTVFDSTGIALEDHLAMDVFLELAVELDIGTYIAMGSKDSDYLDPYSEQVEERSV
jgi:ornithine cyclodeaminase/alanine dehydrogenase-like protein (mu-crystallin family)